MPTSMTQLDPHQGLVLWAMRLLSDHPGWACLVRCEIARRLRSEGVAAMLALRGLASTLARRGRRGMAIAAPAADRLGPGERGLLALVAALQAGADAHAAALAPWLVDAGAAETLLEHGERLARALSGGGLLLPRLCVVTPPAPLGTPSFAHIVCPHGQPAAHPQATAGERPRQGHVFGHTRNDTPSQQR